MSNLQNAYTTCLDVKESIQMTDGRLVDSAETTALHIRILHAYATR